MIADDSPTARDASQRELLGVVEQIVADMFGRSRRLVALGQRPFPNRTSFAIQELEIGLDDGTVLRMLCKDLSRGALEASALCVKPAFLYDPLREIEIYRRVLAGAGLGTAACHAAVVDPERQRYWLFLERVPGVELYQVGDRSNWHEAARWLAGMHGCFAPQIDELGREVPLLYCDAVFYRVWLERACDFVGPAVTRHAASSTALWKRLMGNYDRVIERLAALPITLVHGEFYASNVLVDTSAVGVRICPVDWEMAAAGPGLLDLAALTAGRWSEEERIALAETYFDALRAGGEAPAGLEQFLADLDCCRLHLAVQWLGWSRDWTPPPEHAHDWLGEALMLTRKLGL